MKNNKKPKRFKIYEKTNIKGVVESILDYPEFKTVEEGLAWIAKVLDPNYTGYYGIVDTYKLD